MTSRGGPLRAAASALVGPTVWAAHFLVVYTSESLLCRAAAGYAHTVLLVSATTLALLPLLAHSTRQWRDVRDEEMPSFVARASMALDGLALVAILLVTAAGLILPACR